jgi:hypothetical protein
MHRVVIVRKAFRNSVEAIEAFGTATAAAFCLLADADVDR